jgi:hypothetical protein
MNKLRILWLAAFCALAFAATAQDTNALKTEIGVFESRTGSVIIKGFGQVGSVAAGAYELSVRVKETTDISIGQKIYGLAIEIDGNPFPHDRILVDDNEIDSLLSGINYLIKIKYDVTTLPAFEASYTTKAGLRVMAHSIRREGAIQHSLQYGDQPRILLTSMQLSQLYSLIEQARKNLDAINAGK